MRRMKMKSKKGGKMTTKGYKKGGKMTTKGYKRGGKMTTKGYKKGGEVNYDSPDVPQRKRLAAGYKIT